MASSCDPEDDSEADSGPGNPGRGDAGPDGALADADVRDGARPDADDVPDPDADGGAGERCELPSGSGTTHSGTITADETWTAEDSPHVVTDPLHVTGATLTIEPCAVVRLEEGMTIDVQASSAGASGALVAHGEYQGTTRRPVVFERDDAEPWGSLRTFAEGRIDLEHVDLIGGGDHGTAQNNGGTLLAQGEGGNTGLTRNLRVVDVLIEDSAGFGVNLQARAGFTDNSDSLVIRGAGSVPPPANVDTSYPIYAAGPAFSTIPSGSYTGNATDEIFVAGAASLYDPALRFHERGVPYRFESDFSMQPMDSAEDGGLSTLTIDAGVVIRFGSSTDFRSMGLGSGGGSDPAGQWPVRLIANGTPEAPIVLTSGADNPVAGSWVGVEWFSGPPSGNVMSNVHIEFAGGDSGNGNFGCGPGDNDAALFLGQWIPADAFIQDCTFSDSAAGGIVCGWASDDPGPSAAFAAQNTFENIFAMCNVADHEAANGTCPVTPPVCL